ncbi:MAG: M28 family peptidase [Planctomycetota bacterium]
MRTALALTTLLACTSAQSPPSLARDTLAQQLVDRALDDNQAIAILRGLLAAAPKRLSGSPGMDAAQQWAVGEMRRLGLENVRLEKVMVPCWRRGTVERLSAKTEHGDVAYPITALGGSIGTGDAPLRAQVVVVRSFEELRARAAEAKGKMVLFNRPMPRVLRNTFSAYGDAVPQRGNGAIEAAKVGAVAAIVRSVTTSLDDDPHTGAMYYRDDLPKVPAVAISTNGADALAARVAADEAVELTLELDCASAGEVEGANVVGEIVGHEKPEEIVVIGGHLDAWDTGDGAHDDGAGCVHCLEAARLLVQGHIPLARTLRVVLFANEENGLRGGLGYAAQHADELAHHVAALETDHGGFDPRGFSMSGNDQARAAFAVHLTPLRELGMGVLLPGGGGADINPMAKSGVPMFALLVSDHRYFDYHHSARDTLEAVNERELALGGAAIAFLATVLTDPQRWTR